jgi:hypothetical protein
MSADGPAVYCQASSTAMLTNLRCGRTQVALAIVGLVGFVASCSSAPLPSHSKANHPPTPLAVKSSRDSSIPQKNDYRDQTKRDGRDEQRSKVFDPGSCAPSTCGTVRGEVVWQKSGGPAFAVVLPMYGRTDGSATVTSPEGKFEIPIDGHRLLQLHYHNGHLDVLVPASCDVGTVLVD